MPDTIYRAPIALIAFDRPRYFEQVLQSLVSQDGAELEKRPIYLFQDGSRNAFSGVVRGDQAAIDECAHLFHRYIPNGRAYCSTVNLCTALTYERAEQFLFGDMRAEAVLWLEDDMVLSRTFVATLDNMLALALDDPRIGTVSAYGFDHRLPLEQQRRNPARLRFLRQNWAWGITRHQYERSLPFVEQYMRMVRGIDYRLRPSWRIYDLWASWGMDRVESSQDRAKIIAAELSGGIRINTTACLGRYIGAQGMHSYTDMFERGRFAETQVFEDRILTFDPLDDETYARVRAEQSAWVRRRVFTLAAGQSFTDVATNPLRAFAGHFHQPESWGCWSSSQEISTTFQIAPGEAPHGLALDVSARHLVPDAGPPAQVGVSVNAQPGAPLLLDGKQAVRRIPLPAELIGSDRLVTVAFSSPRVTSPKALGKGNDSRMLGLGLGEVRLVRA